MKFSGGSAVRSGRQQRVRHPGEQRPDQVPISVVHERFPARRIVDHRRHHRRHLFR